MSSISRRKNRVSRNYTGVYTSSEGGYIAKLIHLGQQYTFGPFKEEEDAAKKYDEEVLKRNPKRLILNFPDENTKMKNYAQRLQILRKKLDKNFGKKGLSREQKNRDKYMREKFPIATRNYICASQKWKCNFCREILSDVFIIDHMVPLFLGGSNDNHNLQALCPSCDRFKTSFLDNKVLKPMMEERQITPKDVLEVQDEYFCKKNCINPENLKKSKSESSLNRGTKRKRSSFDDNDDNDNDDNDDDDNDNDDNDDDNDDNDDDDDNDDEMSPKVLDSGIEPKIKRRRKNDNNVNQPQRLSNTINVDNSSQERNINVGQNEVKIIAGNFMIRISQL